MKAAKKTILLVAALALIFALTACSGGGYTAADATAQVKGNLDEIYLGEFIPEYLQNVGITEKEAQETYESGMEYEAQYFISYYGMENVGDSQYEEIVELHKDIYSHAKYEVQPATKQSDGTYAVKVVLSPIAIHVQVNDEWESFMDDFWSRYLDDDINSMTEDEYTEWYNAVSDDYNEAVIDLVQSKLGSVEYGDETSVVIQIVQDDEGYYIMDNTGFGTLDSLMITYPY